VGQDDLVRVGLVLGAGGVTGLAYHAAALAALERELGWDPRSAEVVVGTSAGSVVAGMLRRGVAAGDMAAIAVGDEPASSPPGVAAVLRDRPAFPPVRLRSLVGRPPRLPPLGLLQAWARQPWRLNPVTAVAGIIPDGTLDLVEHTSALDDLLGDRWPDDDLWICAVRQSDLRRTVLGHEVDAPLSSAVAASCAIPGYFRPVRIGDDAYVDGGVRSPTNADVLSRTTVDLAVVVSPMSGREPRLNLAALIRRHARSRLDGERRRLAAAGIPTVVIEPGPEVIRALGTDFMSDAGSSDIVAAALEDTAAQLRAPVVRTLVAGLAAEGETDRRVARNLAVRLSRRFRRRRPRRSDREPRRRRPS
jgi:NTE family protein